MKVRFDNHQDHFDPMNGVEFTEAGKLDELLNARRRRPPFFARLSGENGVDLTLGIGRNVGTAQYGSAVGSPPYLVPVSASPLLKRGGVEFLTANTPTPIFARYIVSFDELRKIAAHFLEAGERSSEVMWEKVGAVEADPHGPWRPRPHQIVLRFLLERWHNPRDETNAKLAAGVRFRLDWANGKPVEVCYLNHQDARDPMNGSILRRGDELAELFERRRKDAPFIAELVADNGLKLVLGIGSGVGFVQFRRIDGDLPYYMARPPSRRIKSRRVAFLVDNVPVPIWGRYVLNFDELKVIVLHFLKTGERCTAFSWETI